MNSIRARLDYLYSSMDKAGSFQTLKRNALRVAGIAAIAAVPTVASGCWAYTRFGAHPVEKNSEKSHWEETREKSRRPRLDTEGLHACSEKNDYVPGCSEVVILATGAHKPFAKRIADELGVELGRLKISSFADGETSVSIDESVRGKDVYLVQSTCPPVHESIMQILLTASALRRSSAKRVTLVLPYVAYMRSLPKTHDEQVGGPGFLSQHSNLFASDLVRMLEACGVMRVIAVDMYESGQGLSEGFFKKASVEHIHSSDFVPTKLASILKLDDRIKKDDKLVVVSPHISALSKTMEFRKALEKSLGKKVGLAIVNDTPTGHINIAPECAVLSENSERLKNAKAHESENMRGVIGNVKDKYALLVCQLADTQGDLESVIKAVQNAGASECAIFASHCLIDQEIPKWLKENSSSGIVTLDTLPLSKKIADDLPNLRQISVAPSIGKLIASMHYERK